MAPAAHRDFLSPVALLIGIAFVANLNVLSAGFVWDDRALITGNALIRDLGNIPAFFSQAFLGMYYRPVVMASFAAEYALWGLRPWGYHLTNLLLHSANALIVFFLFARLWQNRRVAFVAALLFAVHPAHKGVVAIADRTGILSAFFFLLSLLLYVSCLRARTRRASLSLYLVAFACSALAFFSKEETLALPLVLLLTNRLMLGERRTPWLLMLRRAMPFFLLAGLYVWVRSQVLGGEVTLLSAFLIEPVRRLATIPAILVDYIRLLLFPIRLDYEPRTLLGVISEPRIFVSLLLVLSFAVIALRASRKNAAGYGFLWYLAVFLPMSNLIPVYPEAARSHLFTPIHFLYLPSLGIFMCAASGLDALAGWLAKGRNGGFTKKVLGAAVCLILFSLSILSMQRNAVWKDELRFYRYVVDMHPDNPRMRLNLGNVYLERGQADEALEQLREAVALAPDVAMFRISLALAYKDKGWLERALEELRHALELEPQSVGAYINLAAVYRTQNNSPQALWAASKAVELSPSNALARATLALAHMDAGDFDEAQRHFHSAIALDPACVEAHIGLGVLYAKQGRYELAEKHWTDALHIQPNSRETRENLQLLKQGVRR